MGRAEIDAFLTDLVVQQQVAASTQNQALNAILFLYREGLNLEVAKVCDSGKTYSISPHSSDPTKDEIDHSKHRRRSAVGALFTNL